MTEMETQVLLYQKAQGTDKERLYDDLHRHYELTVRRQLTAFQSSRAIQHYDWASAESKCWQVFRNEALEDWNPNRGATFTTYLHSVLDNTIKSFMKNEKRKSRRTVRIDDHTQPIERRDEKELSDRPFERDFANERPQICSEFLKRCETKVAEGYEQEAFLRLKPRLEAWLEETDWDHELLTLNEQFLFRRLVARLQ